MSVIEIEEGIEKEILKIPLEERAEFLKRLAEKLEQEIEDAEDERDSRIVEECRASNEPRIPFDQVLRNLNAEHN